jgi:DNA-binding response OmpR family regulator
MRPIFLVVDPPDPEALSTRKLVLESAKFNVLTAFSLAEAKEILTVTPVQAALFHERAFGADSPKEIVAGLRKQIPSTPIIVLSPHPDTVDCADEVLSSHDPIELVRYLRKRFKLPEDPVEIEPEPPHRR